MKSVRLVSRLALLALVGTGCQHAQLREKVLDEAKTVTGMHYRQVLDNLAMLHANPATLPYFSLPTNGIANVQRTATANYSLQWDFITTGAARFLGRYLVDKQFVFLGGSQAVAEQWCTVSTLNPEELVLMRCAYLAALGCTTTECQDRLRQFFGDALDRDALQPGWFGVGCKEDLPKCACYVGKHCDTYTWVTRDHLEDLSRFTLVILNIATAQGPPLTDTTASRRRALEEEARLLVEILKGPLSEAQQQSVKAELAAVLIRLTAARQPTNVLREEVSQLTAERETAQAARNNLEKSLQEMTENRTAVPSSEIQRQLSVEGLVAPNVWEQKPLNNNQALPLVQKLFERSGERLRADESRLNAARRELEDRSQPPQVTRKTFFSPYAGVPITQPVP